MKLSRESILAKTHFGIKIYVYVLRQFYPEITLSLSGNSCKPTLNPFNYGKKTLQIWIDKNCAYHKDIEDPQLSGDVFDFANKYFKLATCSELYHLLNQLMCLNLKVAAENNLEWLDLQDNSWVPRCSFFEAPIRNIFPSQHLKLFDIFSLIQTEKYKSLTQKFRKIKNTKEKRSFKAYYFPYVTFSGIFKRRNDKALIAHSSLICFDFDDLQKPQEIKKLLLNDTYFETEMLFVSPSGNGIKWIVKIDLHLASHLEYFQSVSYYLKQVYQLNPDPSGKDISRACFLSHDPQVYLHPKHQPFRNIHNEKTI